MCVQEEMYIYVCENFINLHGCQAVFESKIEIKIASFAIFVGKHGKQNGMFDLRSIIIGNIEIRSFRNGRMNEIIGGIS